MGNTGAFSFSTRRRDGGATSVWNTDEFTFLRPLHVASNTRLSVDEPLLAALLAADEAERAPREGIVEFNRANTDSQDIPVHTELVMTKSAFEFLLEIRHDADELVNALLALIPDSPHEERLGRPLATRWPQRIGDRPIRPLEAWAREFCVRRNEGAHGRRRRGNEHFVWSEEAHLAFPSILFPLAVKRHLSGEGFLHLNETDEIALGWIEAFLMHDPFDVALADLPDHERPWNQIFSEDILGERMRRQMERTMNSIDWSNVPGDGQDT